GHHHRTKSRVPNVGIKPLALDVLSHLFSVSTLLWLVVGTLIGVVLGAIPGLGAAIGVVLLLPFTYSMDPATGLLLLGGVFMGGSYGGVIPGILLNIPGTATAVMSTMEGYPMAQKGRARQALYLSVIASGIGGAMGVLALIFFTPTLASFALKFGPPELFLVGVLGLTVVGGMTGNSIWKGLFAAGVGILLSMIGQDTVSGRYRFTFGLDFLGSGLNIVPLIVGLFALSEMLTQMAKRDTNASVTSVKLEQTTLRPTLLQIVSHWSLVARASIMGIIIGIIPGTGASIAAFLSYGEAKRTSKHPEEFGKGNPEGIIATETANNAAVGGALVPLLALGIPGSATTAVVYAALTIHGLIPGPRLFSQNAELAYVFMVGMLLTVVVMVLIGIFAIPWFALVAKIKMNYIIPAVTVFSLIGAYSARNSIADMFIAVFCGIMAVLFRKAAIPIPPVVLGFILGPVVEENFRRSLVIAHARHFNFFEYVFLRPISIGVVCLIVLLLATNYIFVRRRVKDAKSTKNV
ncbi:tripartite tricarboxylate transporter permease, partial [Martelella sp. AMO21009]